VARSTKQALRGCPTCRTKVDGTLLGLRDYSTWLSDALPGKVGASDLDAVLEQSKSGRILIMEFKPLSEGLPTGQTMLLKAFVLKGCEVWVCWEHGDNRHVSVGSMSKDGRVNFIKKMTRTKLKQLVKAWWDDGAKE